MAVVAICGGNQLGAPLTSVSVPQNPDRTKQQEFLKKMNSHAQRVFGENR